MQYSDEEIISQLRAQTQHGFEMLIDTYASILFGAALRMTAGSEEAAKEICKEALYKIYKNARNYNESKGILFIWMLNILRNQALEYIRLKGLKNELLKQSSEEYLLQCQTKSAPHPSLTIDTLRQELRPDQLELLDMIFFKGLNHEDTAKQLRFPSGTVKTRLRAALGQFRKYLTV